MLPRGLDVPVVAVVIDGVDEGTLCDLFAGRRRPTFGTLRALCHALELSLEDVIRFVGLL